MLMVSDPLQDGEFHGPTELTVANASAKNTLRTKNAHCPDELGQFDVLYVICQHQVHMSFCQHRLCDSSQFHWFCFEGIRSGGCASVSCIQVWIMHIWSKLSKCVVGSGCLHHLNKGPLVYAYSAQSYHQVIETMSIPCHIRISLQWQLGCNICHSLWVATSPTCVIGAYYGDLKDWKSDGRCEHHW